LIYDSLLRRDERAQLAPSVAQSWESPDPLTHILHLRSDVKFHDGRPLTARDVIYTIESLRSGELKSLKTGSFSRVQSVDLVDDWTVRIRLKQPYASFLWNLTQGAFGIVPEGTELNADVPPVGSGPFQFVEANRDDNVRLAANPKYWGGAPHIAELEFKVVPDATTRALEMRRGSADILVRSLPADAVESLRSDPNLVVVQRPGNTYQYLALNLTNDKLGLPVRQALAYGIDREAMVKHLWRNQVRLADSVLPPDHWAHGHDLPVYGYNPQRSIALLDAAGYHPDTNGTRLPLQMKTSTDQSGRELGLLLQDQLSRIGIRLDLQSHDFAKFYTDISKGNFDLFSLRWIGGNEDPDIFEYVFHSKKVPPAGGNRGRYDSAEADRLIERGLSTSRLEDRIASYGELQRLLNRELPYIHLWYLDVVGVHSRRLQNVRLTADGSYGFLREVQVSDNDQQTAQ
jgi:peptide/nickel transport system substrate-binding protein